MKTKIDRMDVATIMNLLGGTFLILSQKVAPSKVLFVAGLCLVGGALTLTTEDIAVYFKEEES